MSSLDRIRCRFPRSMAALFVAACMTATSVGAGGVRGAGSAEPTRAASQDGPVTVEATGRGESPKEARKEAIVAALRKVVGEYVEADVAITDDEVVRNEILSFSNAGGVKSEQVGEPRVVGDFVEVTMRVTVEPKPLVARVKGAAKAGAKLDGAALAAEIAAAKDDYEAKKRVLEKAFAELPDAFMTIRIVDSEGKDTQGIDRKLVKVDRASGKATITIPIVLGFDMAAWKNTVYPALDQVLTAAADRKLPDGLMVSRGREFPAGVESQNSVPYTGAKTIPNPQFRPALGQPGRYSLALMRETLGRGRQLACDVFEFDEESLPDVWRSGPTVVPRSLRIRLVDASGDAVDGIDVVMKPTRETGTIYDNKWGVDAKSVFGRGYYSLSGSGGLYPFVALLDIRRDGSNRALVAPLWMTSDAGTVSSQGGASMLLPELPIRANIQLPAEDLELIEKIEVELIKPAGS